MTDASGNRVWEDVSLYSAGGPTAEDEIGRIGMLILVLVLVMLLVTMLLFLLVVVLNSLMFSLFYL